MAHPEQRAFYTPPKETLSSKDPDIAAIRALMGYTRPEPLMDMICEIDSSKLVQDALLDADTFYGQATRAYSDNAAVMMPLRIALPTPSEATTTSTITAIRLLHQVAGIEGFKIDEYGDDIKFGTSALTRKAGESYGEFLSRIKSTDQERPDLHLVITQAKIMIHNALDPFALPIGTVRYDGAKIGVGAQLEKYSRNLDKLMDRDHPWHRKVTKGIQIGKNAILDPRMQIRSE